MKKINLLFSIAVVLVCLAGALHVCIAYIRIDCDALTSFPPYVAFLYLIPYAIAAFVLAAVWLIVFFVKKRKGNGKEV
ncbi:MAG: hypothetical protein K2H43_04935 [Clostridia bacterium]|nr:hypothetical protein [Clostridia bacterium]